jgi:hypothetical protein
MNSRRSSFGGLTALRTAAPSGWISRAERAQGTLAEPLGIALTRTLRRCRGRPHLQGACRVGPPWIWNGRREPLGSLATVVASRHSDLSTDVGFRRFDVARMSQITMNMAAITGPSTMPFIPRTSSPPSVEISTT